MTYRSKAYLWMYTRSYRCWVALALVIVLAGCRLISLGAIQ